MKLFGSENKENKGTKGNQYINDPSIVICPKCGSKSITVGRRGYTFLFGYLLANQWVYKCQDCGKMWGVKKNKK